MQRWRRRLATVLVAVAAVAGVAGWAWQGRAVAVPDAPPGRIACVSYSPFHDGDSPMDAHARVSRARIDADLRRLSRRFACVRTYSQALGLDAVPAIAARYHMHVLLGVWLSADRAANRREVRLAIAAARAHPRVIRAIVVGNEVLLRGDLPPARLVAYIRQVRAATGLPVTYADVWAFWLRYAHRAGLAQAVSFVTIHVLPYWEDDPVPEPRAVAHLAAVYARVRAALPGKRVLIGETGWPSAGKSRRGAVPGRLQEARYIRGFLRYAARSGVPYNLIEAYDQPWKRIQEGTVGGYWGLYDAHGRPKFALQGPVVPIRRWWWGVLAALALGALFAVTLARGRGCRLRAGLAGVATGAALAAAARQMGLALAGPGPWLVAALVWLAALASAAWLVRGWQAPRPAAASWRARLRLGWLFVMAYVDLLLVFDGRYRDYPLATLAVPVLAMALHDLAHGLPEAAWRLERGLLAAWLLVAGGWLLWQAGGLNASVCGWAALNLLLALSSLPWPRRRAGSVPAATPRPAG